MSPTVAAETAQIFPPQLQHVMLWRGIKLSKFNQFPAPPSTPAASSPTKKDVSFTPSAIWPSPGWVGIRTASAAESMFVAHEPSSALVLACVTNDKNKRG